MVSFICFTLQQDITDDEAMALIRSHIPEVEQGARERIKPEETTQSWIEAYFARLVQVRKNEDLAEVVTNEDLEMGSPLYQPFYRMQLKLAIRPLGADLNNDSMSLKEKSIAVYDFYKTPDAKYFYMSFALSVASLAVVLTVNQPAIWISFAAICVASIGVMYYNMYRNLSMNKEFFEKGENLYNKLISEMPEGQKSQFPSIFDKSATNNVLRLSGDTNSGGCADGANPPLQDNKNMTYCIM